MPIIPPPRFPIIPVCPPSLGAEPTSAGGDVTLYKNPQCDCCEGYADYLRHHGFKVKAVPTNATGRASCRASQEYPRAYRAE